jgi:hypothetical protein
VQNVEVGDIVSSVFNIGCGYCASAQRPDGSCLTADPDATGAPYGFAASAPVCRGLPRFSPVTPTDSEESTDPGRPVETSPAVVTPEVAKGESAVEVALGMRCPGERKLARRQGLKTIFIAPSSFFWNIS